MPRTTRLHEYRDVDRLDVAWWVAMRFMQTNRVPTPTELQERFGMHRATSYRFWKWARIKLDQHNAREGHDADANQ